VPGSARRRRARRVIEQRLAVEPNADVIRIDLERDARRPQMHGRLHEPEHVPPRIRELELPQLSPRLLLVDREASVAEHVAGRPELTQQFVDGLHPPFECARADGTRRLRSRACPRRAGGLVGALAKKPSTDRRSATGSGRSRCRFEASSPVGEEPFD
jgi:hypothetical protein